MSLQLHRPDERGVLKPEPGAPPDYREQLQLAALGPRAPGRPAAGDEEPRDAPDVALRRGACSGSAWRCATFVLLVVGYGIGIWQFPA